MYNCVKYYCYHNIIYVWRKTLFNHAPKDYVCPFCLIVEGIENEHLYTKQNDIIYKDNYITAFIASGWWKNNKGHVIIIPNKHIENLYDLPSELSYKIHDLEKEIALALKEAYKCDGVSSRQHNEPCGDQDVWHYHLHVFPRYKNDNLYKSDRENDEYFTERIHLVHGSVLILEGIFLQRKELRSYLDFIIYLDVPQEVRLNRVLARDGYMGGLEDIKCKYEKRYFPAEEKYILEYSPVENADFVLKNS